MTLVFTQLDFTSMLPQAIHAIREQEPIMGQFLKLSHALEDMTHICIYICGVFEVQTLVISAIQATLAI